MAFSLSNYSPEELRNYWNTTLAQNNGNYQNAAQSVYQNAQRLGANYNDVAQFANFIDPNSTSWLNNSILNYAVQNPQGYGGQLAQQGNLFSIFNQQPQVQQPLQPQTYPAQQTGLNSIYNTGGSGGLNGGGRNRTPKQGGNTTPQTFPATSTGPTFTSGSTENANSTIYPQRQWDLNNSRGATYFSPQTNNYQTASF